MNPLEGWVSLRSGGVDARAKDSRPWERIVTQVAGWPERSGSRGQGVSPSRATDEGVDISADSPYGLSPVWILAWRVTCCILVNVAEHVGQGPVGRDAIEPNTGASADGWVNERGRWRRAMSRRDMGWKGDECTRLEGAAESVMHLRSHADSARSCWNEGGLVGCSPTGLRLASERTIELGSQSVLADQRRFASLEFTLSGSPWSGQQSTREDFLPQSVPVASAETRASGLSSVCGWSSREVRPRAHRNSALPQSTDSRPACHRPKQPVTSTHRRIPRAWFRTRTRKN